MLKLCPAPVPVQPDDALPPWQHAWRAGFVPSLSTEGLIALYGALLRNDARLIQGQNTQPQPLESHAGKRPDACCAVCLPYWLGDGHAAVGELEAHFSRACFDADRRLGEPTACRRFLNWWDDTPRQTVVALMLPEVVRNLADRGVEVESPSPEAA